MEKASAVLTVKELKGLQKLLAVVDIPLAVAMLPIASLS
jgi:hypothetical protein